MKPGSYFLDAFSGKGGVSKAARLQGFKAKEYELLHGENSDLTRPTVRGRIKQDVSRGLVVSAMFGPPCSSFSIARDRTMKIRSKEYPWGIPDLNRSEADEKKLQIGNACFRATFELIRCLNKAKIPWGPGKPCLL